jgi:hypothetical protein
MGTALDLTPMNDGSPGTKACAAAFRSGGERRTARLDPSTSASGHCAALVVSARPRHLAGSAVAPATAHPTLGTDLSVEAAGGSERLRSTAQSSPGEV